MRISKNNLQHAALLSRLALTEKEKKSLEKELSGILDHVDTLKTVETRSVEPTNEVTTLTNVSRADFVTENFSREEMLANSSLKKGEYIEVKKIFE